MGLTVADPGAVCAAEQQARGPSICAPGGGPVGPVEKAPADPLVDLLVADRLDGMVVCGPLPDRRLVSIWPEDRGERPGYPFPLEHPPRLVG